METNPGQTDQDHRIHLWSQLEIHTDRVSVWSWSWTTYWSVSLLWSRSGPGPRSGSDPQQIHWGLQVWSQINPQRPGLAGLRKSGVQSPAEERGGHLGSGPGPGLRGGELRTGPGGGERSIHLSSEGEVWLINQLIINLRSLNRSDQILISYLMSSELTNLKLIADQYWSGC